MKNKFIGSILILTGTMIGAGMLALPIVCFSMGFLFSCIALIVVYVIMLTTGLLTLEVNLAFKPYRNHFDTMAKYTLGHVGKIISWISCLFLLYALVSAYIAGNSLFLSFNIHKFMHIKLPDYISKTLVTIILGSVVCWSVKAVDIFNRYFLSFKGILLALALAFMMPHVNFVQLINNHSTSGIYLWAAIPVLFVSFGFHPTIPSITNYVGIKPKKLMRIIFLGSLLPLIIYLLWIFSGLGIIPIHGHNGFIRIANNKDSLNLMLTSMGTLLKNKWIIFFVNGFCYIAMTTSFWGVSLGLFDFIADAFKHSNDSSGRIRTGLLTFVPPLVFTIVYPKGFIYALGYAAFFAAILVIIMPALMTYRLRKSAYFKSQIRIFGGNLLLGIVICIGIALIIIEILFNFHLLPTMLHK